LGNKDVSFVILTYKDNEALEASIVKAIESAREKAETSKYWENWWKVYGLGQIGTLEGVIFNNWQQIDNIPPEAKLIGSGMDFGFTNDPTTLISLYKYNNEYIFHEVLYKKGLTNREIYQYAKGVQGHIIADSAEPKSIHELLNYGLIIQGAAKGSDSILHGIQLLQSIDFKVTSSSTNLIKELRNYAWDKNKTGKQLNLPISAYCHCIDAMRYVASKFLTKQTATKSFGSF
jgi:phage terminase large subunit